MFISTSKTRKVAQNKRPSKFVLNRDCSQAEGLLGWWPMNGSADPVVYDYSGYGYHGIVDVSGTPFTQSAAPIFNNSFFNTNDGVSPARNFTVDNILNDNFGASYTGPISAFCWIYPYSIPGYTTIFDTTSRHCSLFVGSGYYSIGSAAAGYGSGTGTEAWQLVGWSRVDSSTLFNIYRNTEIELTSGATGTAFTESIKFGANPSGGGSGPHHGFRADARIYKKYLSLAEVIDMYDPSSRFDLYYELGKRSVFLPLATSNTYTDTGSGGTLVGGSAYIPTAFLVPVADGTTTNWVDQSAGTTNLYQTVDEGTLSPNDSDYVTTTTNNAEITFLLTDMPADFVSATKISIKVRHATSSSKSGLPIAEVQIVESNNTTAITDTVSTSDDVAPVTFTYSPNITTATNTKATWDGARIRLKAIGTGGASAYIYAIQIELHYSTIANNDITGSGGILAGSSSAQMVIYTTIGSAGTLVGSSATPLVIRNETGSAGVGVGSSSIPIVIYSATGSAGVGVGGSGVMDYTEIASGGVLVGSSANNYQYNIVSGSDGVLCAGIAARHVYETGSAGASLAGSESINVLYMAVGTPPASGASVAGTNSNITSVTIVGFAGAIVAGTGIESIDGIVTGLGGTLVGSSANNYQYNIITSSAGASIAGLATHYEFDTYAGSGGILCNGAANFTDDIVGTSGVTIAGSEIDYQYNLLTGSSGAIVGSLATNYQYNIVTGSDGVLCAGTAAFAASEFGLGGILCNGTIDINQFQYIIGSAGVAIAGLATHYEFDTYVGLGGVLCNGTASFADDITGSSGVSLAGIANNSKFNAVITGSAGVAAAGSDIDFITYTNIGSSGVLCNGNSVLFKTYGTNPTGGALVGSSGLISNNVLLIGDGGAICAGTVQLGGGSTYNETGTGGILLAGSSSLVLFEAGHGGVVLNGTVIERKFSNPSISGGSNVAGLATITLFKQATGLGGCLISGSANVLFIEPGETGVGGMVIGGIAKSSRGNKLGPTEKLCAAQHKFRCLSACKVPVRLKAATISGYTVCIEEAKIKELQQYYRNTYEPALKDQN